MKYNRVQNSNRYNSSRSRNNREDSDRIKYMDDYRPLKARQEIKEKTKESQAKLNYHNMDYSILIATLLLVFIGIIMVYSSSWPYAQFKFKGDGMFFLKRHITWVSVGLIALITASVFPYRGLKKISFLLFIISIGLMVYLVATKENREATLGAYRWLKIAGISFMPSDILKVSSILFLSKYYSKEFKRGVDRYNTAFLSLFIIALASGLVYLTKDLGTTIVIAGTLISIYYLAGMPIIGFLAMFIGGVFFAGYSVAGTPFRRARLVGFLDPLGDRLNTGYHPLQSLLALGTGGFSGAGIGLSRQKFLYLPHAYNDYIFSIIGEELGFIGGSVVILLLFFLIIKILLMIRKLSDTYAKLLIAGIGCMLAIQSIIHLAVTTNSIPAKGITLPFVSYGGTSIVIFLGLIGIVLNISKTTEE